MTGYRRIAVFCGIALLAILPGKCLFGQTPEKTQPQAPYASMDHGAVDYRGPGRAASSDISSNSATIGILLPSQGEDAEQGRAMRKAAERGIADENKTPLSDGRLFSLAVRNQSGSWGQSSSEIMRLITEDQSLALVIGPDGNLAHQAEQIANKLGISIVTLASDATTTEINIPWIFRVVPSDQQQAELIARAIFDRDKKAKVAVISTTDHDGRVGKTAFLRTMQKSGADAPIDVNVDPEYVDTGQIQGELKSAKATVVVFWTGSLVFEELLEAVQATRSVQSIYASEKAAQTILANPEAHSTGAVVRLPVAGQSISQSETAEQVYNAVRLIAAAIRRAGPNRARVRDALALSTTESGDGSGPMFDGAGNLLAKPQLVSVDSSGHPHNESNRVR